MATKQQTQNNEVGQEVEQTTQQNDLVEMMKQFMQMQAMSQQAQPAQPMQAQPTPNAFGMPAMPGFGQVQNPFMLPNTPETYTIEKVVIPLYIQGQSGTLKCNLELSGITTFEELVNAVISLTQKGFPVNIYKGKDSKKASF